MSFIAFTACKKNEEYTTEEKDKEVNKQLEVDDGKEEGAEPTIVTTAEPEKPTGGTEEGTSEEEEYIPNFIRDGEPYDYAQYNFYDADLYVKAPAYHQVSHGIKNFHYGKEITIGYYAGSDYDMTDHDIKDIEDIMDNYSSRLIRGTERYVNGEFESFEFDSIEKVTINDIEMMRYEGNMIVTEYDANKRYVVAYTFIYNGTPNAIFGVAGEYQQEQQDIEELIHNVDESVKTIVPKNK